MSSVGSLSSSTSSSIFNSSNRITGLASGLDTDALIESMTAATRSKIAKQKQDKQLLQWQMDDYRSISSKLIDFQNKYLSYSSETNLRSSSFFDKTLLSVLGDNSKYVSVSGTSKTVENISIVGVDKLAQNSGYVSSKPVSDQTLSGSEITGTETSTISKLDGTYLTFSYGTKNYTVSISDLKTSDEIESFDENGNVIANDLVDKLNEKLNNIDFTDGKKLFDEIEFDLNDENQIFIKQKNGNNALEIKGGSEELLNALGLEKGDKASADAPITGDNKLIDSFFKGTADENYENGYEETSTFKDMVSGEGKTISFTYNGTTKTINLPDSEKNADIFNADGSAKMDKLAQYLETELGKAFGSGRIDVSYEKGKLNFNTTYVDGSNDASSVLKINSGNANAVKALGLTVGDSNRVNMNTSVAESGLKTYFNLSGLENTKGYGNEYVVRIKNNTTGDIITIDKTVGGDEFNENTSLSEIIKAINASEANVEVTYSEVSDKFTLTSKESGASGNFSILSGGIKLDAEGNPVFDTNGEYETVKGGNLGTAIFGGGMKPPSDENSTTTADGTYTYTKGEDAVIWVDYDGEGGADPVQITRSSNTFDIDGLSVTVNGTFGNVETDSTGKVTSYDKDAIVTFGAKVDTEKVTEAVKAMIDAFNEIIEISNAELSEKRNRDYAPLTDEQKEEMTEDQIKAWEEKAKAGMLFNDSDLRGFTSSIRFLFSGDSETTKLLSDMGIETSTNYSDHGKIKFDESKFKAALETNPDIISDLFTRTGETTVDENGNTVTKNVGIMNQVKTVFDKYASTTGATKGIFVQKAGATESPLSLLDNYILDQMNDIDEEIEKLQDKLEMETERYYKQFTSLETFISQMNSQSSWLSSQFA